MLVGLMNILGIETSGLAGSIALAVGNHITQRELATAGRRHAQTLVAELRDLLRDAGLTPQNIDAVAVSIGPGSFTGLRVGVVCAKTFAYATRCKVLAVDSLAAVAQQAPDEFSSLWIISDAQRGDYFTARYIRTDSGWQRDAEVQIVHGPAWLPTLSAAEVIAGPGVSRMTKDADFAPRILRDEWAARPTATAVVEIARPRVVAGETDDFWSLTPLYIRPSAAEEKAAVNGGAGGDGGRYPGR